MIEIKWDDESSQAQAKNVWINLNLSSFKVFFFFLQCIQYTKKNNSPFK